MLRDRKPSSFIHAALLVESEARKLILGDGLSMTQALRGVDVSCPICTSILLFLSTLSFILQQLQPESHEG